MSTPFRASFAVALFLLAAMSLAQPPDPGPYRVGGEITRPEKISGGPPEYTEAARRARIMGVVIVEVVIDEQGDVTHARVLKSLPMGLDQKAVEAVETWKFKPATWEGKPVPDYYVVTVNFQHDSDLPYFGPQFTQFLRDNPDFGGLIRDKSYSEALRWLDARPRSAEIHLARAYVLLMLNRIEEAWDDAQAYDGPEPSEIAKAVASAAELRLEYELDEMRRGDLIDVGLAAAARALEEKKDDPVVTSTRAALLREKAKLVEGEERKKLIDEAVQLDRKRPQPGLSFPEKISGDPAELTELARKAGLTGEVTVEAVIDEQGNVVDAKIVTGLPMGLDEQALEAVKTWKFKPATIGGKAVTSRYQVVVPFRP
jgi:TonB family protein